MGFDVRRLAGARVLDRTPGQKMRFGNCILETLDRDGRELRPSRRVSAKVPAARRIPAPIARRLVLRSQRGP
jgi:hypothetical protein